ncbi:MerR family transcriptional regulator [Actinocorallia aurea]
MQIGEVAEATGLSLRTIRHYDEAGLVVPSGRSPGGFRLYTRADVDRLLLIRRMKPLGFTLEEMRDLLSITDRLEDPAEPAAERSALTDRLRAYAAAADERIAALRLQLAHAEDFAATLHHRLPPESPAEPRRTR